MLDFFTTFSTSDWISLALSLVFCVGTWLSRRSSNKNMEDLFMKFRNAFYRENSDDRKADGQTFSPLVPKYELNERTNELEEVEPLDVDALVQSSKETSLDRTLARLMPDMADDDVVADLSDTRDDLDFLSEAMDVAEEWRDRLNLAPDVSIGDVFKAMDDYNKTLQRDIASRRNVKTDKGVKVDEQTKTQKNDPQPSSPSDDEARK